MAPPLRKPPRGPGPSLPKPGPGRRPIPFADTLPTAYYVTPNASRVGGGGVATIKGSNFTLGSLGEKPTVKFGGVLGTGLTFVDTETLTVTIPAGTSGLVDVVVTNPNGQTATITQSFTYFDTQVSSISPDHGPIAGGSTILISGANFNASPTVLFGSTPGVNVRRIDSQRISVDTPPHAQGQVIVTVDGVAARDRFFYTLLVRGEDFRRNPSVVINETINAPSSMTFTLDGTSAPPRGQEEIEYRDDLDNLMFAGVILTTDLSFEENPSQLIWNVMAGDFTPWLNRRRPFGEFIYVSATDVIKTLCAQYAPWVTTNHVQTGMPLISITLNGVQDFATVLTSIMRMVNGYWRLDYTKDLHAFVLPRVITSVPPTPTTEVGGGEVNPTAPVLTVGAAGSGVAAGYWGVFASFVYANGVESAPGPMSDLVLFDGKHLLNIASIPTGATISGLAATKRRLYYRYFGAAGSISLAGLREIADNVTTTLVTAPVAVTFAAPRLPTVNPPAVFKRAPSADQSTRSVREVLGEIYPDFFGGSGSKISASFTPGTYSFRLTANFDDGTESQPSPTSDRRDLDGMHAVHISTNNHGDDVGTASVMFWKVYASRAARKGDIPDWSQNSVSLWAIIPGNTNGTYDIAPSVTSAALTAVPTTTLSNTTDATPTTPLPPPDPVLGPNPEDADSPSDIDDDNPFLLLDPPIRQSFDWTQIRNRVIVYGPPKVDPPPAVTQPLPATPHTSEINQYLGVQNYYINSSWINVPIVYINSHPWLKPWNGFPFNNHWLSVFQVVNGMGSKFREIAEQNGLTKEYIESHPYTVFMDLPENYYEPGGGAGVPASYAPDYSKQAASETATSLNNTSSGSMQRNKYQFDDVDSQRFFASIEVKPDGTPSDGIHEVVLDPMLPTDAECIAFAQAELAKFAMPLSNVTYATREPCHPGQNVHINLTDPPIHGDFLIVKVDIDQIKEEAEDTIILPPRYNVTASDPAKFDFDDLLLSLGAGGGEGSVDVNNLANIFGGSNTNLAALLNVFQSYTNASIIPGTLKTAELIPTTAQLAPFVTDANARLTFPGTTPKDNTTILYPLVWMCGKTTTGITYGVNRGASIIYDHASFLGFTLCQDLTVDWTTNNRSDFSQGILTSRVFQSWATLRDPRGKGLALSMAGGNLGSGPNGTGDFHVWFKVWYLEMPSYFTGTD